MNISKTFGTAWITGISEIGAYGACHVEMVNVAGKCNRDLFSDLNTSQQVWKKKRNSYE